MDLPHRLLRASLLGLVYFAAAALSIAFTRFGGINASLWFSSGILIAVLGTAPYDRWPLKVVACTIASIGATGLFGMGWVAAVPLAVCKMGEAMVGAWLFKRIDNRRTGQFNTFSWFWRFVVGVGLLAPLVSATGLALVGSVMGKQPLEIFVSSFVSNGLGNMATTPFVLPLSSTAERRATIGNIRRIGWRLVVPQAIVLFVTIAVFAQPQFAFLFVPVIPVMLATIAQGRESAVIGATIIVCTGAIMSYQELGPIAAAVQNPGLRLVMVQGYFAATILTLLPVSIDLHSKRQLVEQLQRSQERFRLFTEQSSDIIVQLDRAGRIEYISPAVEALCGYDPASLIGRYPVEMIDPADHDAVIAANAAMMAEPGRSRTVQWQGRLRDGPLRWFETNGRALVSDGGAIDGTLSVIRDISDHKAIEETLRLASITDPLTGLPNRRAFRELVEGRPLQRRRSTDCMAMLDIDHFKRINDRYGHDCGDMVLRHFANVTQRALREGDLIARLGGEEFGILLPDTEIAEALSVCERLRLLLSQSPIRYNGAVVGMTVSGGVAVIDERGIDFAMSIADRALYEAKAGGRNQLALAA